MKQIVLMAAVIGMGFAAVASAAETVHKIDLPKYQSELPDAEGREAFATSCLACHSTTYIAMQPPLTAAKWEESVRKMQKTYGAPIAEEQVAPIVKYLMAVKEGEGPRLRTLPVAPAAKNELILPATDPAQREKDLERGEDVFAQLCASCHGTDGRGAGPAGLALLPKPADLTAGKFSDEGVARAVCNGVPGTAMAAFGLMPKKDVRSVEAYVQSLSTDDGAAGTQSAEGKQLYIQNCASCHGVDGHGDGLAGLSLPRAAADFHLRRPAVDYAKQVIADGVPGTAMPGWKAKLNEQQRGVLAEYVRGFFEEGHGK